MNNLDKWYLTDIDKIEALNNSIMNGWLSIYEPNGKNKKSNDPKWMDDYIKERDAKDIKAEQEDKEKMDNISLEEVSKRFNQL
jgi:hypothetical protein